MRQAPCPAWPVLYGAVRCGAVRIRSRWGPLAVRLGAVLAATDRSSYRSFPDLSDMDRGLVRLVYAVRSVYAVRLIHRFM